ncbi:C40 family peptidase [Algivirga pacifica]|uniref:C40 family peptidase n=1 Tax=Algivirga pacifica TaxID=1162670 RepID=A0ABP9DAN0_9BACT
MQEFGICQLSVIPVRREGAHSAEQIHQLILGDTYQVLEKEEEWVKIKGDFEGYEGWVAIGQHYAITAVVRDELLREQPSFLNETLLLHNDSPMPVSIGSTINSHILGIFGEKNQEQLKAHVHSISEESIGQTARKYLGTPYLWGGKSYFGIDCSGFSQQTYKLHGYSLPRDAYQQVEIGTEVSLENAKEGDLAFFVNPKGRIDHVGILLSNTEIIHASHRVRIDKIDEKGIYSEELKRYTHPLHIIKRVLK